MIKEYMNKQGEKRYLLQVYLGVDPITGKKRKTTRRGFKTQKEAKLAEARIKLDIEENGLLQSQNMTFGELCKLWLVEYQNTIKESTYASQKQVIANHIAPHFERLQVQKITMAYCQKQVNHWYSYYSHTSNLIGLTTRILDYGVSMEIIPYNPMKRIIRPKRKQLNTEAKQPNYYNKEQLTAFFKCLEDYGKAQHLALFRVLAFTGMRKGECLALRWCDFDKDAMTISINRTLTTGLNGKQIFQTPKTEKSKRIISLDPITVDILAKWQHTQRIELLKLGYNAQGAEQLIFTNRRNAPLTPERPNYLLRYITSRYNLPLISTHGFRHTHCSLLFEAGATIKEVQDRLGHANIKTTMDIYAHVTEKVKEETAYKFAKYMAF